MKDNRLHGKTICKSTNTGKIYQRNEYKEGRLHGQSERFPVVTQEMIEQISFVRGRKRGTHTKYRADGSLLYIKHYEEGRIIKYNLLIDYKK